MKARPRLIKELSSLHQNSNIPFMVFDSTFTIISANTVFLQTFNVKIEELGKRKADFLLYQSVTGISQFNTIPLDELQKDAYILMYIAEGMEISFCVDIFTIGDGVRGKYFYALMRDVSVMESRFIDKSLHALIKASLYKDNDTSVHLDRVNLYSRVISEHLFRHHHDQFPEINQFFIDKISVVAALHDIGKIGTPDWILSKPSDLTEAEFDVIKEHTVNGAFILSSLGGEMARDVALFHHERWDGSGYPYNLKEHDIPLCARIVALADVYDALRMARFYKNPLPHDEAKAIIAAERGGHFDPLIVDAFLETDQEFARIFNNYRKGQEAEVIEELFSV
ncbi:MAG: HD domain-containing protein [Spirochaetales bacterium]|nr:HD domain-containing protein [Spirochaetales bacterium]